MDEYVGKICPYCKTEIQDGDQRRRRGEGLP